MFHRISFNMTSRDKITLQTLCYEVNILKSQGTVQSRLIDSQVQRNFEKSVLLSSRPLSRDFATSHQGHYGLNVHWRRIDECQRGPENSLIVSSAFSQSILQLVYILVSQSLTSVSIQSLKAAAFSQLVLVRHPVNQDCSP